VILKSKAIVIKSFSYSESSLISRLLLENGEKLSIMIKGAKSMKSNKTALFQSMNLIEFNYYNKSTRDIQLFKEGRLIDDFKIVKNNFNSLTYGLGIIDIIDKALPNSYQDSQMFDIAFKCLNKINDNEDYKIIFFFFLLSFSHYNGYSINTLIINNNNSDKILNCFIDASYQAEYQNIYNDILDIDVDRLIRKTLSFISYHIPEISKVKSLKFIN
tara:strand:- start:337 stop:984 length:648 start_codon:yes stop_codon:yes gene_type:complete